MAPADYSIFGWNSSSATAYGQRGQQHIAPLGYTNYVMSMNVADMIKYFRVNKKCEYVEGSEIKDPIDELRIKVAKWLN